MKSEIETQAETKVKTETGADASAEVEVDFKMWRRSPKKFHIFVNLFSFEKWFIDLCQI